MKSFYVKLFLIIILLVVTIGCATSSSSIKGTITKTDTLGGDSYKTIILIDNIWEGVKIAKTDTGAFILYANIITNGNRDPGSLIFYIDGNKETVGTPTDWDIDDVSVSGYMTAKYWSINNILPDRFISILRNSNNVTIRAVNGNGYMGKGEGINITSILPEVIRFISN